MRPLWLIAVAACAKPPVAPMAPEPSRVVEDQAAAWYLRARFAEARGDVRAAELALDWVLRLDRNSPWAWLAVARFRLRQAHLSEAMTAVEEARQRDPSLRQVDLMEAHVLLASNRATEARDVALGLVVDADLGVESGALAVAAGQRACGLEPVWVALRDRGIEDPGWAAVLWKLGRAAADPALVARTAPVVAEVASSASERASAWLDLASPARAAATWASAGRMAEAGSAWLEAGEPERALQVTAHVRGDSAAWVHAGALEVLERSAEAEAVVQAGVAPIDAALRLSRLRALRGDRAGALQALGDAPDDVEVALARAELIAVDDPGRAAPLFTAISDQHPNQLGAWRGVLATASGDAAGVAAGWVAELAPCDDTGAWLAAAEVLEGCDRAEALRVALAARPADETLRERWETSQAACL